MKRRDKPVIKKSNEKNNNRGGDFKCVNDQLPKR